MDASGSVPYANRAGVASAEEIHWVFAVVEQSRYTAVLTTDEWLACLANGTVHHGRDKRAASRGVVKACFEVFSN